MKKITLTLLAAVLLGCIFAAGCISFETVFEYDGQGTGEITVKAGEHFTITAPGNPTTGYSWEVVNSEGLTILTNPDEVYVPDAAAPGMTGVGGTYQWHITAEEPGTYTFAAEYKRSWEDTYDDKMEITIIVT